MRQRLRPAPLRWSALICLLAASGLPAQLSVRPEDPSGLSLRLPRVQLIHSERPDLPGTSMHLQQTDPWLAYAIGHEYFEHEWSRREGVFKSLAQRGAAGTVNSCAMCHNAPFRSAGFGGTVFDPPGPGRRVPHLFGIGLVEMIGFQIRQKILAQYDTNHNGYLDVPSETAGRRARIAASPGVWVDFGSLDDLDGDGMPDLNELIKVTLVDRRGRPLPRRPDGTPSRLGDAAVAGFDIDVGVFSTAIGDHQFSSMRTFLKGVMNTVFGMRVVDPTAAAGEPDGWARVSNAGAPQRHFPLPPEEDTCPRFDRVSEGEVDLLEWYLLNHPPPGLARQDPSTIHGRRLLARYGCTTCHITDWTLEPQSTGGAGDRRFFDLEVSYSAPNHRLEGRVHDLTEHVGGPLGAWLPRRQGYTVRGVYSDFQHHDLGPRFYEYSNDRGKLYVTKRFRTTPLWGVGSLPQHGHDGRSASLDEVIVRHGGEAADAARAYREAPARDRSDLLAFLRTLVLYQPDLLPTDVDGDGRIATMYKREGLEMGPERLNPELLFRVPPRYRGWVTGPHGNRFFSFELLNLEEAYGRTFVGLKDDDHDGIPDVVECTSSSAGRP